MNEKQKTNNQPDTITKKIKPTKYKVNRRNHFVFDPGSYLMKINALHAFITQNS